MLNYYKVKNTVAPMNVPDGVNFRILFLLLRETDGDEV